MEKSEQPPEETKEQVIDGLPQLREQQRAHEQHGTSSSEPLLVFGVSWQIKNLEKMGEANGHLMFSHIHYKDTLIQWCNSPNAYPKRDSPSHSSLPPTHREPYTSDDYSITVHTIHDGSFHTNTLSPRLKILYVSPSLPLVASPISWVQVHFF